MTLSTLVESTECIRLGWTLLHSVWQLATIAALCGVALMLTRSTARVRYVIAYTSLLLMAAAPIATFVLLPPPDVSTGAVRLALGEVPGEHTSSEALGEHVAALPDSDDADGGRIASSETPPDGSEVLSPTEADGSLLAQTISLWSAWFVPFWLLGVAVLAMRHLGGWLLSQRMLARAAPLDNALLQAKLERLAQAMRLSAPVRVLRTAMADVPLIVGWLRPTLLVPVSLMTGLTPEQWDAVLAHELAHIRRRDYAMNLLQIAIETLLFYHPATWWLSRRVRAEREHCCDDVATEVCGNRIALAEALTAIELQRSGAGPRVAVAASGSPRDGSTLHRVRRILNLAEPAERRSSAWIIGVAVLLAITTWCVLGAIQPTESDVVAKEANTLLKSDDPEPSGDSPPIRVTHAEKGLSIEQFLERVETRPAPRRGRRSLHTRDAEGRITTLRLKGVELAPADFAIIGQMQHLEWLDLSQTNVSDSDLEHLASLGRLVRLNLFGTEIEGSGLQYLTSLDRLERLNVGDTKLTEDALPQLAKLTSLRHLCLCRNLINDDGLEQITSLKNLETLKLGETEVTDASVSTLATFPKLRSLTLNETGVTEAGLREVAKLSRLAWIASPRSTLDEFVRRMTSGDLAGANDMVTIGLLVPERGTFSEPVVTPYETTEGDRKRGWHRFQVVFDWRQTQPQNDVGLRFDLTIDRGGVFIHQQALVKR